MPMKIIFSFFYLIKNMSSKYSSHSKWIQVSCKVKSRCCPPGCTFIQPFPFPTTPCSTVIGPAAVTVIPGLTPPGSLGVSNRVVITGSNLGSITSVTLVDPATGNPVITIPNTQFISQSSTVIEFAVPTTVPPGTYTLTFAAVSCPGTITTGTTITVLPAIGAGAAVCPPVSSIFVAPGPFDLLAGPTSAITDSSTVTPGTTVTGEIGSGLPPVNFVAPCPLSRTTVACAASEHDLTTLPGPGTVYNQALTDANSLATFLSAETDQITIPGTVTLGLGGMFPVLTPGVYHFTGDVTVVGPLTLLPGIYDIKVDGNLTFNAGAFVNSTTPNQVFWVVGGDITLLNNPGPVAVLTGLGTAVTTGGIVDLGAFWAVTGRLLSLTGQVLTINDLIVDPGLCAPLTTTLLEVKSGVFSVDTRSKTVSSPPGKTTTTQVPTSVISTTLPSQTNGTVKNTILL